MRNILRVQGRVNAIAQLVSFQFNDSQTNHPRNGYEHRQSLFTWFRHLLAILVFAFHNKTRELEMSTDEFLEGLCSLGLLDRRERHRYTTDKAVYNLVAHLDVLWQSLPDSNNKRQDRQEFTVKLENLRSAIAELGDQPVLQMPGAQPAVVFL